MQQVTKAIGECLRTPTQCMPWLWFSMYWHDMVHSPLFYAKEKPDQVRASPITKSIFGNSFDSSYWKHHYKKRSASLKISERALMMQLVFWNWFYFPKKQKKSKLQWGLIHPVIDMLFLATFWLNWKHTFRNFTP